MDYTQYIKAELLVLVPVLYFIGLFIKNSELIKNNYIPVILGVLGVALAGLYVVATEGVNAQSIFIAITQGIICAGLAVYGDQVHKQIVKLKGDE